jgi:hypothetical protein
MGAGHRWATVGLGVAAALAALGGLGWAGLKVQPRLLPARSDGAPPSETIEPPANLPPPVARFVQAAFAGRIPRTDSAVITGRGRLTVSGVTFPARFRFTERGGLAYHHSIECTWFGYPILKVNEWYLDGRFRQQLPFGTVANEPKADMAANLAFWGEAVWLPSTLLADPRARWEAIDATNARLVVPSGKGEDSLSVRFSQETGLIESLTALRYKSVTDSSKTPWRVDFPAWTAFQGVRVPSSASITWLGESRPWLVINLDDVAYNGDGAKDITSAGP